MNLHGFVRVHVDGLHDPAGPIGADGYDGQVKTAKAFANLPEAKSGRWGVGLTAAKMKECRWLKPGLVAQVDLRNGRRMNICAMRSLWG